MKLDPSKDGIDHINVYSKGATKLGRFLSNFAYSPIETEDGHFDSIEGYWYWLGCKLDVLRTVHGWEAKRLGRELGSPDWQDSAEFKRKILAALETKIETNEALKSALRACLLPLKHYYVYGNKVIQPLEGKWILQFLSTYQDK
jgi:predicted NAD-dependent protein-ADP-ribosyltransferase YbiA (DUF1768 family)